MSSYQSVKDAITRRILIDHTDLMTQYGHDRVDQAIDDCASVYDDIELDEIGSSDVSCWVMNIKENLARNMVALETSK